MFKGKSIEHLQSYLIFHRYFYKEPWWFCSLNQLMVFLSDQMELLYNEHELSSAFRSLKSLCENDHGFKFYHMHFKDFFLLKVFENQVEFYFAMFKVNLLSSKSYFEKDFFRTILESLYWQESLLPFTFQGVVLEVGHFICIILEELLFVIS